MNNYDIEVKERFGNTDAYKEYGQKTADYTKDKWQEINDGLMAVFVRFAECMKNCNTAESNEAQSLVKELLHLHQRNSSRSRSNVCRR